MDVKKRLRGRKRQITATGTDYLGSAKLSRKSTIGDEGETEVKEKLTERA
jgi:hypothetical protein